VSGTALSWIQSYLQDRTQFVKLGQHRSSETTLEVGVPQGSVLGPLLFAVFCSPLADVIVLHLAMRVDNTAAGLSILAACTTDVKQWYMQNGLQLNSARSCNYHARTIRHIRHLLTLDLAQTLACSPILSRIDYCNSVLHGAIQKLQRGQNNAARIVLTSKMTPLSTV